METGETIKQPTSAPHNSQMPIVNDDEVRNLHNKLVVIQAVNYKKHGYTDIKVNHANYEQRQPMPIDGYMPDLTAVLDAQITICEVETHESIADLRTVDKWKAFDNSGYQFHMIVPNEDFQQVKEIIKCNGISVDKYWYIKNY